MATLTLTPWNDLPDHEQQRVVKLMARVIGARDLDALRRVFELCQPAIERGNDANGQPITRVAAPYVGPLRLLIESYVTHQVPATTQ
jgi:hypothetical protein